MPAKCFMDPLWFRDKFIMTVETATKKKKSCLKQTNQISFLSGERDFLLATN